MSRALTHRSDNPPEFDLLRSLCRAAFATDLSEDPAPPLGQVDWSRFLTIAGYHRVEGLAARGVARNGAALPAEIVGRLQSSAQRIAAGNLVMALECGRLKEAFEQSAIPILFMKGATLSMVAYGDLATKAASDIDVLVDPERIADAARLLSVLGYRPISPASVDAIVGWHRQYKESLWIHRDSGAVLDLHGRLAESPHALPILWPGPPTRDVEISPGISLPTLDPDRLGTYLAVHGVSSAWFRLKWIADFAALLDREQAGRLPTLRERMRELGAHHMGDQALLLADNLFGSLRKEPELRSKIGSNWAVRRANAIALGYLRRAVEPTNTKGGTLGIHAAQLLLLDGMKLRIAEAVRKVNLLVRGRLG